MIQIVLHRSLSQDIASSDVRQEEQGDISVLEGAAGDAFGPRPLVASRLPAACGCLGPSGNDRYRKRSRRANSGGFASTAKSRRLLRNKSHDQPTCSRRRCCSLHRVT